MTIAGVLDRQSPLGQGDSTLFIATETFRAAAPTVPFGYTTV